MKQISLVKYIDTLDEIDEATGFQVAVISIYRLHLEKYTQFEQSGKIITATNKNWRWYWIVEP